MRKLEEIRNMNVQADALEDINKKSKVGEKERDHCCICKVIKEIQQETKESGDNIGAKITKVIRQHDGKLIKEEDTTVIQLVYCPMCGKKIEEENRKEI